MLSKSRLYSQSLGLKAIRNCSPSSIYLQYVSNYGNTILSFKDVTFQHVQSKPLLNGINFNIVEGSKVTIMGQNGSGKSTLFNLINGTLVPEIGSINIQNNLKVSLSKQVISPEESQMTVLEYFRSHAPHLGKTLEGRIHQVFNLLEFEVPLNRLVGTYSGGQKARLLLAAALLPDPDVLLLDEPTNNLDVAGIDKLTEIILGTDKTCVVVSHDEEFLNTFSDTVLYIDSWMKKVEQYDGNYNDVKLQIAERIKKENQENTRKAKAAQEKKDQANKFQNKGGVMRKAAQKLKDAAAELESTMVDVRREDKALTKFEIPNQAVSGVVAWIKQLTVPGMMMSAFNGSKDEIVKFSLKDPMELRMGAKVRITGRNGIGKTTYLENIVNGSVDTCGISSSTRIGYYRQDFSTLNYNHTVIESLRDACKGNSPDGELKRMAAQFMLTGQLMNQKISTLSEGQKGLCSFARLVLQEPGLLILDEPTNHINFRHLPAIAHALNAYKGVMILVSHDQSFVDQIMITDTINMNEELQTFEKWLAKTQAEEAKQAEAEAHKSKLKNTRK